MGVFKLVPPALLSLEESATLDSLLRVRALGGEGPHISTKTGPGRTTTISIQNVERKFADIKLEYESPEGDKFTKWVTIKIKKKYRI